MKNNFAINHLFFVLLLLSAFFSCKKEAIKTAPTITTTDVSAVTTTGATSGGNVTSDGGATVSSRGVCWATSSDPTVNGIKSSDGSGLGNFSSSITGLYPGTTYFARAYAINSVGTAYGNETTFTTKANLPTLSTTAISTVTSTTATSGGNITADGGGAITARGVCWGTTTLPTTSNSKTTDGTGIGTYTAQITGLTAGASYFVRSYATNSAGTVYGNELTFSASANLATITTNTINSITSSSAAGGGAISSDGGGAITARGVCWNTLTNPTTANSKTNEGTGTGAFTSAITGLSAGATYYVRAYSTNSAGTVYGNEVIFSASANLPTITTNAINSITTTTAASGGTIISDGGGAITAKGICWSATTNPTIANNKTNEGTGSGTYTSAITGLTAGSNYYIRSYATNSAGTVYGNELTFTTSANLATLTTNTINSVTFNSAASGGTISSDGGGAITAKGVCWSTSINPTTANSKTNDGIGSGTYNSVLSELAAGSTYFVRAYATNSAGTAYGNQQTFIMTNIIGWVANNAILAYRTDANYSKLNAQPSDVWTGEASHGIDGDLTTTLQNTWWVGSNPDVWYLEASFYYDMQQSKTLSALGFYCESGAVYGTIDSFQLYYSDDSSVGWTLALNQKMPSSYALDWYTFAFPPKTARYWKLTAKPTQKAFGIREIAFGNFDNGIIPKPTPIASPSWLSSQTSWINNSASNTITSPSSLLDNNSSTKGGLAMSFYSTIYTKEMFLDFGGSKTISGFRFNYEFPNVLTGKCSTFPGPGDIAHSCLGNLYYKNSIGQWISAYTCPELNVSRTDQGCPMTDTYSITFSGITAKEWKFEMIGRYWLGGSYQTTTYYQIDGIQFFGY